MKVKSIIFIFLFLLAYAGSSQKLNESKEIKIIKIDSTTCRDLYVIVFKFVEIKKERHTLLVDKTELLKTKLNLYDVDHKYNIKLEPIQDFTTNTKYSCLTRLENASAVFIDNIMIWNQQKGIYPYKMIN